MNKLKFNYIYFKVILPLSSFLLSLCIGPIIYCLFFYVHEFGHIIYAFTSTLIHDGTIIKFHIGNWIACPGFEFIKLPQQVIIDEGYISLAFAFGGIILVIIFSIFLAYIFYKQSENKNKKYVFLFPLILFVNEILGNFICGTDNPLNNPYFNCEKIIIIKLILESLPFLLVIPTFLILSPYLKDKIIKWYKL